MAKTPTSSKGKDKSETKPAAEATETKKRGGNLPIRSVDFGVNKVAEAMGKKPAEVRVLLRAGKFAEKYKKDDVWDFSNQKTVDAVAKELKDLAAERAKRAAENPIGKKKEKAAEA